MPSVKIFISENHDRSWDEIIDGLVERGIAVYWKNKVCDTAVILSGRFINPLVFPKNRILVTSSFDWVNSDAWHHIFACVLEEYYKEVHLIDTLPSLTAVLDLIDTIIKNNAKVK